VVGNVCVVPETVTVPVDRTGAELNVCTPVKVCAASVRAIVAVVVGNVITVLSVPESVRVFVTANVFAFVSVNVPVVAVMMSPLMLVAVATPSTGVVSVGEVARTTEPVPWLAVTATPAIESEFPVPAVSYVLFVKMSVVAFPTRVSVAEGSVSVPEAATAGVSVVLPEVEPERTRVPSTEVATPRVRAPLTMVALAFPLTTAALLA
jgi:hypothetical protein